MERLRQRSEFLAVSTGARIGAPAFSLQGCVRTAERKPASSARVGFTVTKKTGNAVERNRIRRRLREMVKLSDDGLLRRDCDYVLVARREALHRSFQTLIEDFRSSTTRLDLRLAKHVKNSPDPRA
jgi:ribonuclease P protein component